VDTHGLPESDVSIIVEPIKPLIGGIVHVDRATLCDEETVAAVRSALEDRCVLVFPTINLTDDEQLAFTDELGTRVNYAKGIPDSEATGKDVYKVGFDQVLNGQKEFVQGTFFWHIDGVMVDAPVSKATLLTARKLSDQGGETEFANLFAAYEGLPAHEKAQLEGLRAIHNLAPSMRLIFDEPTTQQMSDWRSRAQAERPIVWTHKSGRRSLVIGFSADRVVGMPVADGRALIMRLIEWAAQPDFRYTHQWRRGDLVLWDNTAVMHRVIPYDEKSGRTMHRTTIAGLELIA
jgi:alpha-ketoglutarate-dependent taurine dioxygenase